MRARLFQNSHGIETRVKKVNDAVNPGYFACLGGNDVISANVSDHHPVIHQGVLFWNVMMQGRARVGKEGTSYNNGFGFIETEKHYLHRLAKVAHVIAEIIYHNPTIQTIGLCEGPIQSLHINAFIQALNQFKWMKRFTTHDSIHQPTVDNAQNWGLLMLSDKKYQVSQVRLDSLEQSSIFAKLANRFQIWKLSDNNRENYFALAHFPFGGDEHVTEKNHLSILGNMYCDLINDVINRYAKEHFILCADFNFNPYLLKQWQDRALDQITNNNSIVLTKQICSVTVDGILLSAKEKQLRYSAHPSSLFNMLARENRLFKSYNTQEENRIVHEYIKRMPFSP